ncbi:MAG: hypothetical protein V3T83_21925, partial [Acidobacteriota bacterium]
MRKQMKGLLLVVGLVAFFFATFIQTQEVAVTRAELEPAVFFQTQELVVTRAELEPAMAIQNRHTKGLMKIPEIVGTAVGVDRSGHPIIKLYTRRAGVGGLPGRLDGLRVSVEVVGEIEARKGPGGDPVDTTIRFDRPVPIGVSTGHPAITAGTIGARLTDGTNVFALSNNHVYADVNAASIGDAVIQPGTFDGGTSPADDIGNLAAFETIDFVNPINVIDAAIASTTILLLGDSTPSNGYGTPRSTIIAAAVG